MTEASSERDHHISSFCTEGGCVGVALGDAVEVIDTKVEDGPKLHFTREEWVAFVAGVKAGEFDLDSDRLRR